MVVINQTKIEWVKNPDGTPGYTWNPITGCLNNCPYCYARKLANGRLRERYLANKNWDTHTPEGYEGYPNLDPFYPRFWMNRIEELDKLSQHEWGGGRIVKHWQYPKGIFVCDMGELFGDWIPESWQTWVFEIIKRHPKHRFYLLTKQPQNLHKFSPFPDNCWVGVTATNWEMFYEAKKQLARVNAKIKYLSLEPLLNWYKRKEFYAVLALKEADIKWVIIGAQTKPYKPPKIEWVREIVEACDKAGVPVFLKDNLGWPRITADGSAPFYKRDKTGTWILRQEMPE